MANRVDSLDHDQIGELGSFLEKTVDMTPEETKLIEPGDTLYRVAHGDVGHWVIDTAAVDHVTPTLLVFKERLSIAGFINRIGYAKVARIFDRTPEAAFKNALAVAKSAVEMAEAEVRKCKADVVDINKAIAREFGP